MRSAQCCSARKGGKAAPKKRQSGLHRPMSPRSRGGDKENKAPVICRRADELSFIRGAFLPNLGQECAQGETLAFSPRDLTKHNEILCNHTMTRGDHTSGSSTLRSARNAWVTTKCANAQVLSRQGTEEELLHAEMNKTMYPRPDLG